MIQGSPEWYAARLGRVTASRVSDVLAKTKSGWGASRGNYMAELIVERLTNLPAATYTNAAMQWGVEKEPEARAAYEFYADVTVEEVGFVNHPHIALSGASPDGLVGADGLVEIKCPNTNNHLETLLGQAPKDSYVTQMQWQMACTGRKWCDFVSYDPRLPEAMRFFTKRIMRDGVGINTFETEVISFLAELDAKLARLNDLYAVEKAA